MARHRGVMTDKASQYDVVSWLAAAAAVLAVLASNTLFSACMYASRINIRLPLGSS